VAEDACAAIVVEYAPLDPVVGIDAARAADRTVHDDVPDNVAAHLVQQTVGDAADLEAAMSAAPHVLELELHVERSASMPMEGKGVLARWDLEEGSLRVHTSTQASTSVRAAVAAKLDLPLTKVHCVAPDVGGGFGVKIVHPWPEELLVPMAAIALGREVKWAEDRRVHFISSADERGQLQQIRVGFDVDGRLLALDVRFWHDHGAHTPYGLNVPIITPTPLHGPNQPQKYDEETY
jgi:CO/xanthine dehydrogenase Mo-binding subunit